MPFLPEMRVRADSKISVRPDRVYANTTLKSRVYDIRQIRGLLAGFLLILVLGFRPAFALDVHLNTTGTGILEDAILIASSRGACPQHAIALGDLDLSQAKYSFDINLDPRLTHWWLIGHLDNSIVYSSLLDLGATDFYIVEPHDLPDSRSRWSMPIISSNLNEYTESRVKFRFGIMSDTHYYSEPLATPHPIQAASPGNLNLSGNLNKIRSTLLTFEQENVAFGAILGDVVEDHASWPTETSHIINGALTKNLTGLNNVFDEFGFPIHLVVGNHDVSYGTTRSILATSSPYYSNEPYDFGQFQNRMDYTFEAGGVRFIVYDNVQRMEGANRGFRSANEDTLEFLRRELLKVSRGGIDSGKPVIIMAHARADCLASEGCNGKIDLSDKTSLRWTQSADGTDEFYLEAATGGDPMLDDEADYNQFLWENSAALPQRSIGALLPGTWNYGSNPADVLDFETIYLRLSSPSNEGSWDPNNAPAGFIQYKYVTAGAAENYEDIAPIFEQAAIDGAKILGVLQGHEHKSRHNTINGVEYFTFSSFKRSFIPETGAIVDVLFDNTLSIQGLGVQTSYISKRLRNHEIGCSAPSDLSGWWENLLDNHSSHVTASAAPSNLWEFSNAGSRLGSIAVNLHETIYGDGNTGNTDGWDIYDADPVGASIRVIGDSDRQGLVFETSGEGRTNGFRLLNSKGEDWDNTAQTLIEFSIKFSEPFSIFIDIQTSLGQRYIQYTNSNSSALGAGQYIKHGLGASSIDGEWHTFIRDLQTDLNAAQPEAIILAVNSLLVRGSGKLDDIKMLSGMPTDTDGDGIMDIPDNCPTISNTEQADTNEDGIGDACAPPQVPLDTDGDGISDRYDNCPTDANFEQSDSDSDGTGDACEPLPPPMDTDYDGIADVHDNCPTDVNFDQVDSDSNGVGDVCEPLPPSLPEETSNDVPGAQDSCTADENQQPVGSEGTGSTGECETPPTFGTTGSEIAATGSGTTSPLMLFMIFLLLRFRQKRHGSYLGNNI